MELDDRPIVVVDELNRTNLAGLVAGSISAIWHKGYYSVDACEAALPQVRIACEQSRYTLTPDLQSLGTSIGEAAESSENERTYFETAFATANAIRRDIFGYQRSPIDSIRLDVDDLHPAGAVVGKRNGEIMLSGIIRRWESGGKANPHMDQCRVPVLQHLNLKRRIGVNIYVAVPPEGAGGEIEFWGLVKSEDEYQAAKRSDYGLNQSELGEPAYRLRLGQGDLLAFDAARVHSVAQVTGGERVTVACFLGVPEDLSAPISIFA